MKDKKTLAELMKKEVNSLLRPANAAAASTTALTTPEKVVAHVQGQEAQLVQPEMLSDDTLVGLCAWKVFKVYAMKTAQLETKTWFNVEPLGNQLLIRELYKA